MILRIKQFIALGNLGLLSLVLLLSCQLANCVDIAFSKEECDEQEFYVPYAKIAKTRKGPVVKGIYQSGFIDLRPYSGLLCLNGPAFLYLDFNETTSTYVKSEPQVFSHGCFGFNRREMKDYRTGTLPPLDSNTTVFGLRLYGVLLIGAQSDYRGPQIKWFRHPQYGFKPPEQPSDFINGSSFGIVVQAQENSYCFEIESERITGEVKGVPNAGDESAFCFREEQDEEVFDEVFRKNLTASNYDWFPCDPNGSPDPGTPGIDETPPDPMPDFRIIDPALLNPQGSPGKLFKGKKILIPTGAIEFYSQPSPSNGTDPSPDGNDVTEPTMTNVQAYLTDCEPLPKLASSCGEEPDEDKACDLLQYVLTIKEVDWNSEKLMKASWRKQIMDIIVKIYQKVCPQVSKALSPAVTRVVEYFIFTISEDSQTVAGTAIPPTPGEAKFKLLNEARRSEWDSHLIPDLNRCLAQAKKIPFYRTRDLVNEQRRKEINMKLEEHAHSPSNSTDINLQELEDAMRDAHVQFPYHIWLPPPPSWNNKTQIQIRVHVEAAEIDYNLDWAIDTFWKVFSTVLGYCNKEYALRTATFKRLYSFYTEDILDLVVEQWVQNAPQDGENYILGNFEKVYDQLFGEFVNGVASRYIDACNDGAYWWADVPDFRPVRPVYLKEGATQGGSSRPVNFFIEHPLFPSDPAVT